MMPDTKIYEEKMKKTLGVLQDDYQAVRAGRANPGILDRVMVDYYGAPTKISSIANVSVSEGRTLVIAPYDRSALKGIEKAILTSDIGINPNNDGSVIRLPFPQLTEERRKELCKGVRKTAEESKVAIRSIRRDANDKFKAMKKTSEITEDEQKDAENKIQKMTDKFCEQIDKLCAEKEKEIMSV